MRRLAMPSDVAILANSCTSCSKKDERMPVSLLLRRPDSWLPKFRRLSSRERATLERASVVFQSADASPPDRNKQKAWRFCDVVGWKLGDHKYEAGKFAGRRCLPQVRLWSSWEQECSRLPTGRGAASCALSTNETFLVHLRVAVG